MNRKLVKQFAKLNGNYHHQHSLMMKNSRQSFCLCVLCMKENPKLSSKDQPIKQTLKDPLQMAMQQQREVLEEKSDEIAQSVMKNFQPMTTNESENQRGPSNNEYSPESKYKLDDDGIDRNLDGMGRILNSQQGKVAEKTIPLKVDKSREDFPPTQNPPTPEP